MKDRAPADILHRMPSAPLLWWIGRTKPRQEKKFARWLSKSQLGYFLPLRRNVRNWRGRRIRSEEPLLSGYVFFLADAQAALHSFKSGALAERIEVANQAGLYDELLVLETLASLDRDLVEMRGLAEGREVELKAGPCKGMRGIVVRAGEQARFCVKLEIMGRFLEIALDPAEVEAL